MLSGLRALVAVLGRPFAGIPLALRDEVYRPLFVFFLLIGTTEYWQQLTLVTLTAAGLAIGSTALFVYAQQLAPGRAATATGWINACFFLGLAGGSPLAGRVVELAGFRGLFVFSGVMDLSAAALVGALVVGLLVRRGSPALRTLG